MEKNKYSKTKMLQFALIAAMLFGMYAFKNGKSVVDIKLIPNDQNEAKVATSEKEKDAKFLVYVANVNAEEIKLGQLAQQKSTTTEIKELGKMMETAHSKCMGTLTILAKKKAIALPTVLNDNGNDAYEKLKTISVSSFDKEYCDIMIKGHKAAIAEFKKVIKETNDADIKQFATNTLPELQSHLDHASSCQKKCK
jgi:putative membrane protein